MATLIGLCIRVKLMRVLPSRFKVRQSGAPPRPAGRAAGDARPTLDHFYVPACLTGVQRLHDGAEPARGTATERPCLSLQPFRPTPPYPSAGGHCAGAGQPRHGGGREQAAGRQGASGGGAGKPKPAGDGQRLHRRHRRGRLKLQRPRPASCTWLDSPCSAAGSRSEGSQALFHPPTAGVGFPAATPAVGHCIAPLPWTPGGGLQHPTPPSTRTPVPSPSTGTQLASHFIRSMASQVGCSEDSHGAIVSPVKEQAAVPWAGSLGDGTRPPNAAGTPSPWCYPWLQVTSMISVDLNFRAQHRISDRGALTASTGVARGGGERGPPPRWSGFVGTPGSGAGTPPAPPGMLL